MIEINLVPDVKQELIKARQARSAVVSGAIISMIIAVAVVALLATYVYGGQNLRGAIADKAIKDGSTKLASVDDLSKVLTIQNQLTKINALNDDKKIDSRVFDLLQAIIPPEPNQVQISSFIVDAATSTIRLEGQTAQYPGLEAFKKTIDAAYIRYQEDGAQKDVRLAKDISLADISYGEDSTGTKVLRFTLSFGYATELFSPKTTAPSFVLINGGNVTDSHLGIPKSIFTDRASDTGVTQ